jgi:PAS domain S-box-containing protein
MDPANGEVKDNMEDEKKTRAQLIDELTILRHRIADLEASEVEHKRTEKTLWKADARCKALFDRTLYCIYVHDFEGRFLDANDAALNLLGYTREELPSINISSLLGEDQLPTAFKAIEEIKQTGRQKRTTEYKLTTKDGDYVWVETEASLVYQQGKPYAIQGIAKDITERKEAEEALQQAKMRFEDLFETANELIITTSGKGWILRLNKEVERHSGYSKKELIGKSILEIAYPEDVPKYIQFWQDILNGLSPHYELRTISKTGVVSNLLASGSAIRKDGNIVEIQYNAKDITEEKQAEEKLQKSEERYRSLFETATDGIFTMDLQTRFTSGNRKAEEMCGYSRDELIGEYAASILPEEEIPRMADAFKKVLKGKTNTYETRIITRKGELLPVEVTSSPVEIDGKIICIMGMARDIAERKKAEQALKESEERYRTQFEQALDAIFLADAETGMIIDCNRAARKLVDRKKSELVGQHQRTLHPPHEEMKGDITRTFKQHLGGKEGQVLETQVITEKGEIKDVAIKANVVELRGKKIIQGIFRDITERKQAEKQLRESEEFSSSLLSNSPNPIVVINPDTSVKYVNPALEKLTGFSSAELVDRKAPYPWWTEETLEKTSKDLEHAMLKGAQRLEELFQKRNGERFSVEITSRPVMRNGELRYYLANWVDITEQKKAQERLTESESKFRAIFENIADIYYQADLKGNVTLVNPAAVKIMGYDSMEEAIGKNIAEDFYCYPADRKIFMEQLKKHGEVRNLEVTLKRKDGRLIIVEVNSHFIHDNTGKPIAVEGIAHDITRRKRQERKLQKSYRLEAKLRRALEKEMAKRVEFTRALMHELKTPLTPVVASSEMLVNELQEKPDSPLLRLARNIYHGASNLNSRVDELLDLARGELNMLQVKLVVVNPRQLLQEMAGETEPMVSRWGQSLILDLPSSLPLVRADEERLRQVVLNLITNASKFTPAGGKIILRAWQKDANLLVACQDTGSGIAKEDQGRLFNAYHRVGNDKERFNGLGLGLALCRKLVELHGGKIWLESEYGEGSTFIFTLPLAGEALEPEGG